eukprot:1142158-Pelagomonas_calceolata.AAC.1
MSAPGLINLVPHIWLAESQVTSKFAMGFDVQPGSIRKGKVYIAVPAYACSLAGANTVPVTKQVRAGGQNIQFSHSISGTLTCVTNLAIPRIG